ncbi:MAG: GTPase Era [Desulfobulbaceae bacterium]|uniref:GTPase Era n=1 Tax=Candidatus Desulfobia pelagia TaxID=2841692 RepID=A0A8J6NBP9_9BACT|nr:GTPase Era [Candidatus Desulfobia pelagia]
MEKHVKTGVVALIGPPNVGKSTLLNHLLGQKISIVSPKPQTTRNRILGIVNGEDHQVVLLDTPGIHRARSSLNLEMVKIALDTLSEVDAIIFMIDTTFPLPEKIAVMSEALEKAKKPVLLLVNKIDLSSREKLLPILNAYGAFFPFRAMIPLSAKTGDGVDILMKELLPLLPEGPRMYPEDIPTDATERFIASEIIREKIFLLTTQEIPYSTAVVVDSFKEDETSGLITIHATIHVEKKSQKGIIIGRQGAMLKKIGQAARKDIVELLGAKIMLNLWVKIRKDWTKDGRFLKELGLG